MSTLIDLAARQVFRLAVARENGDDNAERQARAIILDTAAAVDHAAFPELVAGTIALVLLGDSRIENFEMAQLMARRAIANMLPELLAPPVVEGGHG
jgi:hypothetical protein